MSPKRVRRLWLEVKWKIPSPQPARALIIERLKQSILDGTYNLPKGWQVIIAWRNKENASMKYGPWKAELQKSAASSDGFNKAVLDYLDRAQ